jgi:hypothetical protein
MAPDYIDAVTTNPELETVFFLDSGQLGVTLKKRAASSAATSPAAAIDPEHTMHGDV